MPSASDKNRLKTILGKISFEEGQYICSIIYKDPFKDIYKILLMIFVFILLGFLLWPFDFVFFMKNNTRWIKDPKGIEFFGTGQAISGISTQAFFDRLTKGTGLTLEMWLKTEDLNQTGPARIISYSVDPYLRNFTIGQSEDQLVIRLRTTETNLNGMNPHLVIEDTFNSTDLQYLVIMYDFLEQNVYINGERKVRSTMIRGDFSNWDPSCRLVMGNEVTGNRPWKGKIYYAAVFDRPLAEKEIQQHYLSGLHLKRNQESTNLNTFILKDPVARYVFDEGRGNVFHDIGSASNPVGLFMPQYINLNRNPFLGTWSGDLADIIINILIFIPLGILIHGMLRTRFEMTIKISFLTLLLGTVFTLSIESMQYFSITRYSSIIDVFTNTMGVAIGIVADRIYMLYLDHQVSRLQKYLYDQEK